MTREDFDAEVYEYAKSRIDTEDSRMTDRMLAYRAGAEPREKKIELLEELLDKSADSIKEFVNENKVLAQNLEDTEIINKALEKENAELKALLNCNNCSELSEEECEVCAEYSHFKCKRKGQLTKAKEIMKHLLDWQYDEYKKSETDKELFKVIAEAEQFLKGTEE